MDETLKVAAADLRLWARCGEKAAALPEGEEPAPSDGREGDIPASLAEAQRLLWDFNQRWRDELSELNGALRQKVCQQYVPVDLEYLQATADVYSAGQRIPRALKDPAHGRACKDIRARARAVAAGALLAKEVALAAVELHKTEYLVLQYSGDEAAQDLAKSKSKLLAAVAESLVDGTTPPVAAPYFVGLFERAVVPGRVDLDSDAKLRLVPRIARALVGSERAPPLGEREGARLLKASLDPDALLEARKLREFATTLALVMRWCCDVQDQQATSLLRSFDAQRFAVLVAEKPGSSSGGGGGGGSGSGGGSSKRVVSPWLGSITASFFQFHDAMN